MKKQGGVFVVLGVLVVANIFAWIIAYDLSRPRFLEVNFFSVGQGDSIFIETSQMHQILIDGGPDSTILEKLGAEMPFWDRSIDLIILTHPEKDHLAGLLPVLKRYKIDNILWTGVVRNTAEYQEWKKLIETERAKIKIAKAGQKLTASRTALDVLYPFENFEQKEIEDSNNTSIVIRLVFGQNSFLFTGDIYQSVEKELIEQKPLLDSDILKIAHHGSRTSSSEEFIEKVSPDVAVISVGKNNNYGHPHQETLETLKRNDINILRTDLDGDIKIISNGLKLKVE